MGGDALTSENGTWGEMVVAAALTKEGNDVFLPWGGHTKADMITCRVGEVSKIQVKKATWHTPENQPFRYLTAPINPDNKYKDGDVDEFIFVSDEQDMWRIPWDIAKHIGRIVLTSSNPNYKPRAFVDVDAYRWKPKEQNDPSIN